MDCLTGVLVCDISIHAPRTGSDAFPCLAARAYSNFNPRSPHGERLNMGARTVRLNIISIHAPRTGSDLTASPMGLMMNVFQSTLPARGATLFQYYQRYLFQFQSTLPARGATWYLKLTDGREADFNPRSPHGERLPP